MSSSRGTCPEAGEPARVTSARIQHRKPDGDGNVGLGVVPREPAFFTSSRIARACKCTDPAANADAEEEPDAEQAAVEEVSSAANCAWASGRRWDEHRLRRWRRRRRLVRGRVPAVEPAREQDRGGVRGVRESDRRAQLELLELQVCAEQRGRRLDSRVGRGWGRSRWGRGDSRRRGALDAHPAPCVHAPSALVLD